MVFQYRTNIVYAGVPRRFEEIKKRGDFFVPLSELIASHFEYFAESPIGEWRKDHGEKRTYSSPEEVGEEGDDCCDRHARGDVQATFLHKRSCRQNITELDRIIIYILFWFC